MKSKTFKEILKEIPTPKPLTVDTKLPHIFDTLWDCKTIRDLILYELIDNCDVRRHLAQEGFDTTKLTELPSRQDLIGFTYIWVVYSSSYDSFEWNAFYDNKEAALLHATKSKLYSIQKIQVRTEVQDSDEPYIEEVYDRL